MKTCDYSYMASSPIIGSVSFLILLILALFFLYLSLKGMYDDVFSSWKMILEKLRLRNDMIPNLLETVRKHSKDEESLLGEIAVLRSRSWPLDHADAEKVQIELELSEKLHTVWKLSEKNMQLKVDTNFLSMKKSFIDLGKEIDEMVDRLNQKIRSYNQRAGFFLLKPFIRMMKLKTMTVFEFEP